MTDTGGEKIHTQPRYFGQCPSILVRKRSRFQTTTIPLVNCSQGHSASQSSGRKGTHVTSGMPEGTSGENSTCGGEAVGPVNTMRGMQSTFPRENECIAKTEIRVRGDFL